jgi:hypothetical protein
MATDTTERKYNNLAFVYPSELRFSKKNLSWTPPITRVPYTKKDDGKTKDNAAPKKAKRSGDAEVDDKDKKQPIGDHFFCEYVGHTKNGDEATSQPRFKTPKGVSLTVKLVQKKDNKMRIVMQCDKTNEAEMEIITAIEKYDRVFADYCIGTNGKQVKFVTTGKAKFTEDVFWNGYGSAVRNDENKKYATFTINIPIYAEGENTYGTKFYSKGNNKEPISIDENNFYDYISPGSRLKIAMTIKEHWISGTAHGCSLVANSISIIEKPPKPVLKFKQIGKAAAGVEMEFYPRDHDSGIAGTFSIGGSCYYRDNEGKQMPWLFQTPVMQTKWSVKSKFTDKNGKHMHVITADVSDTSDTCQHASKFLKGLQMLDESYRKYIEENKDELFESFDEVQKSCIDMAWIKNKQSLMAKPVKTDKDRAGNVLYNFTMKLPRFSGKLSTEVYNLTELLAAQAAESDEMAEQINDLSSEYYTNLFQTDLRKTLGDDFGTTVKITDANVDTIIPPGTQFVAICKTERWGSWVPEESRETAKGHGHGLYTQILKLFILRYDDYHYGGGGDKAFNDDDLESDGDDSDKEDVSSFKFSDSAKKVAAKKLADKKAEEQAEASSDEEPTKKTKPVNDEEESEEVVVAPPPKKKTAAPVVSDVEEDEDDEEAPVEPPKKRK